MQFKGVIEKIERYKVKTRSGETDKYYIIIEGIKYSNWGTGKDIEIGHEVSGEYEEKNGFNNIKEIQVMKKAQVQQTQEPIKPQEDKDKHIIREVALKCAVDLLKAPCVFDIISTEMSAKKSLARVVIDYADMFTAWINDDLIYEEEIKSEDEGNEHETL